MVLKRLLVFIIRKDASLIGNYRERGVTVGRREIM